MERLKKQLEENGVEEDAEGSEEEIDENGKPVARKRALRVSEARRVEIERQIDEERRRLLEDTEKTAKQKEKIARDLKQKELELQAMKEADDLKQKLEFLQRKLIVGGEDLTEKAARQAKLLEESEKDLEERTKHEARIKKELQEKEAETLEMKEKYNTLKDEADDLTKKLDIFERKLEQGQQEYEDLRREYLQQRSELMEANSQALRELQRQEFIISSYIPEEYLKLIQENAEWNEQFGEWNLKSIAYTGNNIKNRERRKENLDDDVDLTHVYLAYTAKGAEKAMRDFMVRKKKAQAKEKKKTKETRPSTASARE